MDDSNSKKGKSVVVLSFDDGRADQLRTAQYLQEQGVPAVFNITTGYLEGNCSGLTSILPMSIDNMRWIVGQKRFEIAAHGDMHENTISDIVKGRDKLHEFLQFDDMKKMHESESGRENENLMEGLGFASPSSKMSPTFIRKHEKQLRMLGFSYIRTGSVFCTYSLFRKFCRKAGRFTHLSFLYKIAYEESLTDESEKFCFTSIPIMADTTLREVESLIDLAVHRNKICVLMFHSVLDKGENGYKELWTWDRDKFECLVQYLKGRQNNGDLSVMNIRQFLKL